MTVYVLYLASAEPKLKFAPKIFNSFEDCCAALKALPSLEDADWDEPNREDSEVYTCKLV